MPISQKKLDHLNGTGVVVKRWYVDQDNPGMANVSTSLLNEDERELWLDAAFTNGGPLVKIELVWAPQEADRLRESSALNLDPSDDKTEGAK